jgi:hypothetical protein
MRPRSFTNSDANEQWALSIGALGIGALSTEYWEHLVLAHWVLVH